MKAGTSDGRRYAELTNGHGGSVTIYEPVGGKLLVHTGMLAVHTTGLTVERDPAGLDRLGLVAFDGMPEVWVRLYDTAEREEWEQAVAWVCDGVRPDQVAAGSRA